MNSYEAKQEARRERYEELAQNNRDESARRHQGVRDICDRIPFGQPILVGHHSEKGARADQRRIDNGMRKAIEHSDKANYYDSKAASVGKGGISSDDPEAVVKLKDKLTKLRDKQEYMKRINKLHRAYAKGDTKKRISIIEKLPESEQILIQNYEPQYSWEPNPYPPYALQNNNANLKRVENRIKALADRPTEDKETTVKGVRVLENAEENRIQLFFDGKPSEEIRTTLKRNGFRWSRYNMAWQRHLNNAGRYASQTVLATL